MYALLGAAVVLAFVSLYLWHLNRVMAGIPDEVSRASPHRWTPEEIKATYAKLVKNPIDDRAHLPPKQERRYIVVGGSGLVGGCIILHLLARGQSPESIRLVDSRPPVRKDYLDNEAARKIQFCQTDITSNTSTNEAFDKPWPKSVAHLPLTVIHTAAVINASERAKSLLYRCLTVNLDGTINVLSAAKRSGADVFIGTSSGSVDMRPVDFWIPPWTKWPRRFVQTIGHVDTSAPLRPHEEYFGNYAVSKAAAEKAIIEANSPNLRTGVIRPTHGIYGHSTDHTLGTYMHMSKVPSWVSPIVQNFVYSKNVSVAHLQLEAALTLPTPSPKAAGKSYVITDPNPAISYGDMYTIIPTIANSSFELQKLPPIPIFLLSYLIEAYTLFQHALPASLGKLLPTLPPDIVQLQPTLFNIANCHLIADDSDARKSVEEGGLGYKGICTTLEAMCMQIREWNMEHADGEGTKEQRDTEQKLRGGMEVGDIGAVGLAMGANTIS
ncbi:hypothetical protein FKW77_010723 [Venturia effusa]|uniref:3-beta hydroxysteroid dehydrogenase/isomerase domain-containing protein n=1 Tax=Venturia effusa TaxID=50376 RepID=A0A517KY91_9PEZI|nr:hypothetical protein FKW77_010723 [Venturia effusa]